MSYGACARTVFPRIRDKSKIVRGENPIILTPCMTILWFFGFFRHFFSLSFSIHIAFTPHIQYYMCAKMGKSSIWPIFCWSESIPLFLFERTKSSPNFLVHFHFQLCTQDQNPATCGGTDVLNCRAPPLFLYLCMQASDHRRLTQVRTRRSRNMEEGGEESSLSTVRREEESVN